MLLKKFSKYPWLEDSFRCFYSVKIETFPLRFTYLLQNIECKDKFRFTSQWISVFCSAFTFLRKEIRKHFFLHQNMKSREPKFKNSWKSSIKDGSFFKYEKKNLETCCQNIFAFSPKFSLRVKFCAAPYIIYRIYFIHINIYLLHIK